MSAVAWGKAIIQKLPEVIQLVYAADVNFWTLDEPL